MEAAKWTFTSSQLQDIVSRAIRQSAEASSIRLLRLEILDNEIPEEKGRLEAQRTELLSRYKSWARRRTALIEALGMYVAGGDEDTAAYAVRMVDDLRDVTAMLDRFANDLHAVDAELAHLDSLLQTHSGSALAIALRKLNEKLSKHVKNTRALQDQLETLSCAVRNADTAAAPSNLLHKSVNKVNYFEATEKKSHVSLEGPCDRFRI